MNSDFNPSANALTAVNKAWGMLCLLKGLLTKEIFVLPYNSLVRSHLEYAIQANCPYIKRTYTTLKESKWHQQGGYMALEGSLMKRDSKP